MALANYLNEERQPATQNAGVLLEINHKKVCSCPQCGQDMVLKKKPNSSEYYVSCMGFPECRGSVWFPQSVEHVDVSNEICNDVREKQTFV